MHPKPCKYLGTLALMEIGSSPFQYLSKFYHVIVPYKSFRVVCEKTQIVNYNKSDKKLAWVCRTIFSSVSYVFKNILRIQGRILWVGSVWAFWISSFRPFISSTILLTAWIWIRLIGIFSKIFFTGSLTGSESKNHRHDQPAQIIWI